MSVQVLLDDYDVASVATDLVNTAPEVAVSTGDGLADPQALHRFLHERRVAPDALAGGRSPTPAELAAVHRLRGEVRAIIDGADPATPAAELIGAAAMPPALTRDATGTLRWQLHPRPDAGLAGELAVLLGVGLLSVIRVLGPGRLRQCASPACRGAFVDISRGGRRRYCVPEVCGNRINVANHRARRRGDTP